MPVILTGGMRDAPTTIRGVFEHTGAAAVMLARGALGNPWLFEEVLGTREDEPTRDEIVAELAWVHRPRRRAPRASARGALPAQVLPLVRRAPRAGAGEQDASNARSRSPSSAR